MCEGGQAHLLGGQQRTDQVVPPLPAAAGDLVVEVIEEFQLGLPACTPDVLGLGAVEQADDALRPGLEALAVLQGDPEHLGDDDGRERERELGHQLGAVAAGEAVAEVVGDRLDARRQALHRVRGERAGDERAQPGVVGRVAHQHAGLQRGQVGERGGAVQAGNWGP